ncbi:SGNH/GDSL hydrolase family protein [Rubrivivax gelatinosus]|nr:SGNH/GDSL hydrolase family protein [Rubrivivax gelatinosus]
MPSRHPSPRSPRPLRVALAVAALGLLLGAGCAASRIQASAELARESEPFQASPEAPAHRLLIVGDSTAVGTGASSPRASLAGLIAAEHADWLIVNRARDGAKFGDVAEQLGGSERFDTVLLLAGGNDVVRLTGAESLRSSVDEALGRARVLAPRVIVMPSGNVGNAPFFLPPWSWWMTQRSRELHRVVRSAATRHDAAYVDLFKERRDDPFAQQPKRLNAPDGLHPSDEGYRLWREELRRQAAL